MYKWSSIEAPYSSLKPDLLAWNDNEIKIVEFSCPYDMQRENGEDTMEETYKTKRMKYSDLVQRCEAKYNKVTKLYIIIVSSLGAIYKETINDLNKLYKGEPMKKMRQLYTQISNAAITGSYFIFYKIPFKVQMSIGNNDEEEGEEEERNGDVNEMVEDDDSETENPGSPIETMNMNSEDLQEEEEETEIDSLWSGDSEEEDDAEEDTQRSGTEGQ